MNSPSVSYISKTLLSILFVACLVCTPNLARAQDYTEDDFKIWQDIQAEKDDAKKVDMIVKFLHEKPKNGLRPNMTAEYQKAMVEMANGKKWAQVIALGDRFLEIAPNDSFTITNMAGAYEATGNSKGFATFGEKVYASKPSSELALAIARAYQKLGNEAKYLQWREKVLEKDPENIEVLMDMMKKYMASQNWPQAVKYSRTCLKVLPEAKRPEGMNDPAWKETQNQAYAIAYGVIGADAYQKNNYPEAIRNLDSAVKYYKRYEMAYYYLGMSYWRQSKLDAAMLNFAKAYIIKGPTANSAKQYLDQLWKPGHRNSTAGEERVIERAQQDLKQ